MSLRSSLTKEQLDAIVASVPDEAPIASLTARKPVHVVYGGAHLYRADSSAKLAKLARAAMDTWGKDDAKFASLVGGSDATAKDLAARVREKLHKDPVEKTCIDFEDGYGPRPDSEEDAEAVRTAGELARMPARRAAHHRHSHQGALRPDGKASSTHARSLPDCALDGHGREASSRLHGHAPEGRAHVRGGGARVAPRHAREVPRHRGAHRHRADGRDAPRAHRSRGSHGAPVARRCRGRSLRRRASRRVRPHGEHRGHRR